MYNTFIEFANFHLLHPNDCTEYDARLRITSSHLPWQQKVKSNREDIENPKHIPLEHPMRG